MLGLKGWARRGRHVHFQPISHHATHSWPASKGKARSAKWHGIFTSKKRPLPKACVASSRGDPELSLMGLVIPEPFLVTISDGAKHGERT